MSPWGRNLLASRWLRVTLLAAVAIGLGAALLWQERDQARKPTAAAGEPAMDAEIWGVHLRQRDGDRRWRLRADHAAHYPEPGVTRLSPVRLEVARPGGPPLTAESRRGRVADGSNQVTLIEDVVVVDPAGYRLTTDTLDYFPEAARAETVDPVRVTADFGEATGIGATVWTDERRVKLHEQVNTTLWRRPDDAS
jgi:LPS export ABC transporter protein LptC